MNWQEIEIKGAATITTALTTAAEMAITDARDQLACLQPGNQKHHAFDEVDEKIPKEDALKPRSSADQPKAAAFSTSARWSAVGTYSAGISRSVSLN